MINYKSRHETNTNRFKFNSLISPIITDDIIDDSSDYDSDVGISSSPPPTPIKRTRSTNFKPLKRHNSNPSCRKKTTISNSLVDFDFTFNSKSDISDLESLPDLTEDDFTPENSPIKSISPKTLYFQDISPKKLNFYQEPLTVNTTSLFDIPEIVHKIVTFVDEQNNHLPQELSPTTRNHQPQQLSTTQNHELAKIQPKSPHSIKPKSHLFNCLLVNKLFHQVTSEIISRKFYFDNESKFSNYISSASSIQFKPKLFILHKLFRTKQSAIDKLTDKMNFSNLNWLELYMCPKLAPVAPFLGHKLTKLIITGSKTVDNEFLTMVSGKCPNLSVLDVRACEFISDAGIYQIGNKCCQLTNINFGRKSKGHLITDSSLSNLINNNPNLSTVGLAGCHISDKTIWDLAINCSNSLQRLSLNNCPYISNQSIPLILTRPNPTHNYYFQNLSVLELRFNLQITNWRPIIEFKRRQEYRGISILLEACDTLMLRIKQQELDMDKMISQRIFKDILNWANNEDDGDVPFHQFIKSRN